MIRTVIGTSPQLTKSDQLHTSLKDQIRRTDYQRVRQVYDRLLASLQTSFLGQKLTCCRAEKFGRGTSGGDRPLAYFD